MSPQAPMDDDEPSGAMLTTQKTENEGDRDSQRIRKGTCAIFLCGAGGGGGGRLCRGRIQHGAEGRKA